MTAGLSDGDTVHGASVSGVAARSDQDVLRGLAVAAGVGWSILFVIVGVRFELQAYGDGSIFSYAVAVGDAWAFHWHNIAGRTFVYLASILPAEFYVAATGDARGGIALYGFLFFAAPFAGLVATWAADRSAGRVIFSFACGSTACLCPLVFGFPTEMWMAHAVFWPALALCHYAERSARNSWLIFAVLLALVFTHPGGAIFAGAIAATLTLRGLRSVMLRRTLCAFLCVVTIWIGVKVALPPDDYFAPALAGAALHVFSPAILRFDVVLLVESALAIYGIAFMVLQRRDPATAHAQAAAFAALALAIYWFGFDRTLHAENCYYLRTALVVLTPAFGVFAAVLAVRGDDCLRLPVPLLPQALAALTRPEVVRGATGAIAVLTLVHLVETTKFVRGWTDYKAAVRALAMGPVSDPALGDPRFVSATRIAGRLNRLTWMSTTHFLSVLLAPGFAPVHLVVDQRTNYFWLSCETATDNLSNNVALPATARRLIRRYSCLHRR